MSPLSSIGSNRVVGLLMVVAMLGSALAVGTALGAVDSTAASSAEAGEPADLRVVHASPDAPPVDVYVDNESVLSNVSFGTVSDYLSVPEGTYTITITAAGDRDAVVFEGDVSVESETAYTVAAAGEVTEDAATSFAPVILTDNATTPGEDEAAVRLAHLSPDAPAVDVTVAESGDVLFDNVSFANATDYATVPAGDYTLEVRPATASDDGDVVTTFEVSLEGETAYTGYAVGYLNPDEAPADTPFDLLVSVDETTPSDDH